MHDDLHAVSPYDRYGTATEFAAITGTPAPGSSNRDEFPGDSDEFIPNGYSGAGGSTFDTVLHLVLALAFLGFALFLL